MNRPTRIMLLLAPLTLGGCATLPPIMCGHPVARFAIRGTLEQARPMAVDLVFVTDPALARTLSMMDAHDYFAAREQLERDYPKGWRRSSWELSAGQAVTPTPVSMPCGTVRTFIFAAYPGEGTHRVKLERAVRGTLILDATEMRWVPDR